MYSWKTLAWISAVVPILSLFMSFLLPESPSWLVSSGQKRKCFESLKKLRGSTCDVQREMNTLIEFCERQNTNKKMSVQQQLKLISSPRVLKPFLILNAYFFIYQMSGSSPVTFYAVTIFEVSIVERSIIVPTPNLPSYMYLHAFSGVIRVITYD